jgi:hypothetical protein
VPQVRKAKLDIRAKAQPEKLIRPRGATSEAHSNEVRPPERNEVKPKDLHFFLLTTMLPEAHAIKTVILSEAKNPDEA